MGRADDAAFPRALAMELGFSPEAHLKPDQRRSSANSFTPSVQRGRNRIHVDVQLIEAKIGSILSAGLSHQCSSPSTRSIRKAMTEHGPFRA